MNEEPYRMNADEHDAMQKALIDSVTVRKVMGCTPPSAPDAGEIAAKLTDAQLESFAYPAAINWCGEKERETFPGDITYFMNNWRSSPGFREWVVAHGERKIFTEGSGK